MTEKEFLETFRHEFFGMIAMASINTKRDAELSIQLRAWALKVDQLLAKAYQDAQPKQTLPPGKKEK